MQFDGGQLMIKINRADSRRADQPFQFLQQIDPRLAPQVRKVHLCLFHLCSTFLSQQSYAFPRPRPLVSPFRNISKNAAASSRQASSTARSPKLRQKSAPSAAPQAKKRMMP